MMHTTNVIHFFDKHITHYSARTESGYPLLPLYRAYILIMDGSKSERQTSPFKKFSRLRVKK